MWWARFQPFDLSPYRPLLAVGDGGESKYLPMHIAVLRYTIQSPPQVHDVSRMKLAEFSNARTIVNPGEQVQPPQPPACITVTEQARGDELF